MWPPPHSLAPWPATWRSSACAAIVSALPAPPLAQSALLDSVHELDLSDNPIGSEGIQALAGSAHLGSLTVLYLSDCPIDEKAAQALVQSKLLTGLEDLHVSEESLAENAEPILRDASATICTFKDRTGLVVRGNVRVNAINWPV